MPTHTTDSREKIHDSPLVQLLLITACNLPVFYPLLGNRFFWSHENAYFLWRVVSFHQNVIAGTPLCRWFPDFARGFGLPFLEFYPVLPLYVTELFRLPGASTILSVKFTIILTSLFAAWGAYLLGKEIWGKTGGLISSVLYSYAPYKMVNLYVRGDINEYTAMSIAPWIIWLITRSAGKRIHHPVSVALIIAFSLPALTHYPSCVIQYPVYVFWILCLYRTARQPNRFLVRNLTAMLTALIMTSTYWASALLSRHFVQMEGMTKGFADYKQHFINAAQWLSNYWNFGASVKGPGDAISFQVGNAALVAMLLGTPYILPLLKKPGIKRNTIICSLILLVVSLFLTHESSARVWNHVPALPMLQFAYRILAVPALLAALLGGSAGLFIDNRFFRQDRRIMVTAVVMILIILFSVRMCRVANYMMISEDDLTPGEVRKAAHTHCTGEYIPRAVGKRFPPPVKFDFKLEKIPESGFSREDTEARLARWMKSAVYVEKWQGRTIPIGNAEVEPGTTDVIAGDITISNPVISPCSRSYYVESQTGGTIRINQFYFEGWTAQIDDRATDVKPDPGTGLMRLDIPPGPHSLRLCYRNLPLSRKLGVIGILTGLLVVIWKVPGIGRYEK
ncbi:hypothetical protein JW823_07760 [bacterium]|nr:hypothetical protein [candidate division CSSED10-310 bacterium]